MDLAEGLRRQAQACGHLGSPMYAVLLARAADDLEAGGPVADVLADHAGAAGPSAVGLRLAGSLHRLVLERRAGALGVFYPSVGGTWDDVAGWAAVRTVLAEQPDDVAQWLDRPPQTNEVGRASGLAAGLLALGAEADLPVRLFEIGASAGLNLLADRFAYVADDGRTHGTPGSPVVLDPAWEGPVAVHAPWPRVVERLGSDVMPIDPTSTQGRLALTAYVWADQAQRHERLRGALGLAARHRVVVRRQGAGAFVDGLAVAEGTTTVLWHSVMWQYLDAAEQRRVTERVEALGASATATAPFAHLFLEPTRRTPTSDHEFLVVLRRWPDGERRVLGRSSGHGLPTVLE